LATVYVFNNEENRIERYYRSSAQAMPYIQGSALTVAEFAGTQEVSWTDTDTMNSWNSFKAAWPHRVLVNSGFLPITADHCLTGDIYHYFGVAFNFTPAAEQDLDELYELIVKTGCFRYVERLYSSNAIRADNRWQASDVHRNTGLPDLLRGSRNNYVMMAQSALQRLGYRLSVDGVYGAATDAAVRAFQHDSAITQDGIIARIEWHGLLAAACRREIETEQAAARAAAQAGDTVSGAYAPRMRK